MLISTTPELMQYVEVSIDLDFVSIKPSIQRAERRFIKPYLGTFFNEVEEWYNNQFDISDLQKELISLINSATGPLALWYYSQRGSVSVDSSGIYKAKNENRWNLGEGEQRRLENSYLNDGLDALDDVFNFLNENLMEFEGYANSAARANNNNSLVRSARVLQKVFTVIHPYVTFRALQESILYVEDRVKAAMQSSYAYFLSTPESELSAPGKDILFSAQKVIIYMATARALLIRTVKFTNEGLQVLISETTQVSPQENSRIEAASAEYRASGETEMGNLVNLLNANPPTGYTPPLPPDTTESSCGVIGSKIVFV